MEILLILIGVLLGVPIVSFLMVATIFRLYFVGTLRVDRSDKDQPYMFLELEKDIRNVTSKKYVLLQVRLENYIPHK